MQCALTDKWTSSYTVTNCGQIMDVHAYNRIRFQPTPCCPFCREPIPTISKQEQASILRNSSEAARELFSKLPSEYSLSITQKMVNRFSRKNEMETIGKNIALSLFNPKTDTSSIVRDQIEELTIKNAIKNFQDFLIQLPSNSTESILEKLTSVLTTQLVSDSSLVVSIIVEETRQQTAASLLEATRPFYNRFWDGFSKAFSKKLRDLST